MRFVLEFIYFFENFIYILLERVWVIYFFYLGIYLINNYWRFVVYLFIDCVCLLSVIILGGRDFEMNNVIFIFVEVIF